MGRNKIDIQFIKDDRVRNITFNKRKSGLLKKACELATLCGVKLLLCFTDLNGHVYEFQSTENLDQLLLLCENKQILTTADYPEFHKKREIDSEQPNPNRNLRSSEYKINASQQEQLEKLQKKIKDDEYSDHRNTKRNNSECKHLGQINQNCNLEQSELKIEDEQDNYDQFKNGFQQQNQYFILPQEDKFNILNINSCFQFANTCNTKVFQPNIQFIVPPIFKFDRQLKDTSGCMDVSSYKQQQQQFPSKPSSDE